VTGVPCALPIYRITYDEALPYALRAVRDRGRDESLEVYVRYCWKWLGK
jgi:hypothetical protein